MWEFPIRKPEKEVVLPEITYRLLVLARVYVFIERIK